MTDLSTTTAEELREYAAAIDKDRTFETGLSILMRKAAAVLEAAEKERDAACELGEFDETPPGELARRAYSIAEDVNEVCRERCFGSLSLAVMILAQAVEALATGEKG